MGIEPTPSAWKAEVLPLNYTRVLSLHLLYLYALYPKLHHHIQTCIAFIKKMVEGEGFEPSKAEPSDLQSDPFDRSGTPPKR